MGGRDNLDLLRGTFELLLLKAVSEQPRHGHQVMRWLRTVSDETFLVEEGAIYPALHRLESKGLVRSSWGTSEHNRRAKFYRLTARGQRALDAERTKWARYVETVDKVLHTRPA